MVPERLLMGGAATVLLVSAVALAAVPGALSAEEPEPVRPARLRIAELDVAPGHVGGDAATLAVETRIEHAGGPAENVSLLLRAVSLDSGLVETTRVVDVDPIRRSGEVPVRANLTVPRSGGYRIESVVFDGGERRVSASKSVRGVEALKPEYARTSIEFHRFARTDHPVVEYSVSNVSGDRARLRVQTYLTNSGSDSAGGLRLSLTARQADSNIVADQTDVAVGSIASGRTATPEADLVVPDGYNYYLDAILWKDGVIVGTARSVANLNPTETISANASRRDVHLEVSDFEGGNGRSGESSGRAPQTTHATGGQPGFTAVLAVVALLGAALLARRWSA